MTIERNKISKKEGEGGKASEGGEEEGQRVGRGEKSAEDFLPWPRFRATHDNYANGDAMLKTPISLIRRRPPSFLLSFFSLPSPGKLVQP